MLKNLLLTIIVVTSILTVYGLMIEPNRVVVREVRIPSSNLTRFFGDATVVHLTDLQSRGWGLREMQIVKELEKLKPDYVFVTGDFSQEGNSYEPVIQLFESVPEGAEIYGVLGNTDYNQRGRVCLMCHVDGEWDEIRSGPIQVLRNETIFLKRGDRELALVGLDSYDEMTGHTSAETAIRAAPFSTPKIVLAHTPEYLEETGRRAADLYLAGDTHGGQVALPTSILSRTSPTKDMRYRSGLFHTDHGLLYVSSGIGWNSIPIRIGVPPEIIILKFEEATSQ